MASSWQQQPEVGQKFWKEGVGSGVITHIYYYKDKLVVVDFFEKGIQTFEYDEVIGNWSDELQGTWMLYNI